MEERARSEGRELVLWLVGMPLAVVVATVTLSALVSAMNPYSEAARAPFAPLPMVVAFGLPSAIIARALRWRRASRWTYFALAGAVAGFIGFAALAVVLIWAEGSEDLFTAIAGATWLGAARVAWLTVTIAWPGAIAGLAGGGVFGVFAKWVDDVR
jgi:hypothetical protein